MQLNQRMTRQASFQRANLQTWGYQHWKRLHFVTDVLQLVQQFLQRYYDQDSIPNIFAEKSADDNDNDMASMVSGKILLYLEVVRRNDCGQWMPSAGRCPRVALTSHRTY